MYNYKKRRKKGRWAGLLVVLLLIASLLGGIYYLLTHYKIKEEKVYVDGNLHYTKQEIMDFVMEGPFGDNSLYLSFRYKNKSITDIPFIAAMDVTVLAPDSIRISVFEKSLAGYVEYLGRYMYFDKDGIIVESSSVRTAGIPEVTGLTFDHVVVGQPLPVENKEVFYEVLTVTQSLDKYDLTAERIYFNGKGEMTLFLGDIRVAFGTNEMLDEKIILIQSLMPKMEGMKGTLDIKNYSENTKIYTFEPAK